MTIHAHITPATVAAPPAGLAEQHFKTAVGILETTHADAAQGWTPQRQSQFLAAIADGATVADAAQEVGLSRRSAYAFRRTAKGAAFRLGWQAAEILAADSLREDLWDRAKHGQTWTVVREDGERTITTTRHRFDNRLALAMLTRLEARVTTHPSVTGLANRFDDLLAVLAAGDAPAFVTAPELLAHIAPPPDIGTCEPCESDDADDAADLKVWWDGDNEQWLTLLPAPAGFDGDDYGCRSEGDYIRTLSAEEHDAIAHFVPEDCELPDHPLELAAQAERAAWFAAARHVAHPRDVVLEVMNHTPLPLVGGDDSPGGERGVGVCSREPTPQPELNKAAYPTPSGSW